MTEKFYSELVRSLAWLQLVVDELPQTIFGKDLNSNYLGSDLNFAKICGMDRHELIGKSDYDMPWTKIDGRS